jgi:5-formyltetrahydrofolate cyclo-ligase
MVRDMKRAEIIAWRKAKRDELIAARMAMPQAAHADADAAIARRIDTCLDEIEPCLIGAYWPFRREFNVLPVLDGLIAQGFTVALPVVLGRGRPLEFRHWTRETKLASGVYDIPYPAAGDAVQPRMLIVPLLGFDDEGYRLGYGGGFYDRTLEALRARKRVAAIGVGFNEQVVPEVPHDPNDQRLDWLLTDKRACAFV